MKELNYDDIINAKLDEKEAKELMEVIIEKLDYHSNLYYNEDNPEISDYDYDRMMKALIYLEESFPKLKRQIHRLQELVEQFFLNLKAIHIKIQC